MAREARASSGMSGTKPARRLPDLSGEMTGHQARFQISHAVFFP
jgi:hypothetical protein